MFLDPFSELDTAGRGDSFGEIGRGFPIEDIQSKIMPKKTAMPTISMIVT